MSSTDSEDYTSGEITTSDAESSDHNDLSESDDELAFAASERLTEEVNLLIIGSEYDVRGDVGSRALYHAAGRGHVEVVATLLAAGAPVDGCSTDVYGRTPLDHAVANGHAEVVTALLKAGASVEARRGACTTPLGQAAEGGHFKVVEVLLAAGVSVDACCPTAGETPLLKASKNGHIKGGHSKVVELLLAAGANVAAVDANGFTSLVHAADKGCAEIVKLLLAAGADIEAPGMLDLTALCYAAQRGHIDVVLILIKAGAKLDPAHCRLTPLHLAVFHDHADVVREFLAAGADPDDGRHMDPMYTYERGENTPLMIAARKKNVRMVFVLLKGGTNVNTVIIKSKERQTALMIAAGADDFVVVQMLLEAGADPFIPCDVDYELSTGLMPRMALDFARTHATRELLKSEMNRRKAAALSVMPAKVPLHVRQDIMWLAYSWKPSVSPPRDR